MNLFLVLELYFVRRQLSSFQDVEDLVFNVARDSVPAATESRATLKNRLCIHMFSRLILDRVQNKHQKSRWSCRRVIVSSQLRTGNAVWGIEC